MSRICDYIVALCPVVKVHSKGLSKLSTFIHVMFFLRMYIIFCRNKTLVVHVY